MGQVAALPSPGARAHLSAVTVDVLVAALLLAGALAALMTLDADRSPALATVSCVLVAGAVAMRRPRPLTAALVALVGLVGYQWATHDPNGAFPPVAVVLTFYLVGRSGTWRRRPVKTGVVVASALAASSVIVAQTHSSAVTALSSWLVVSVLPLAVGVAFAFRSALSQRLTAAAAELSAEQELNAERATAEERNRVARDLHDVVAHCVSVMVVQAGAARLVVGRDPGAADQALAVIGSCGRDALADLRRIVGVLRRDVDPGFGCGAGLADLPRLAQRIGTAGVPTTTTVSGDVALPAAMDVVAYLVVQEALTNVVKHAGDGATADVHVTVDADEVLVHVTDTGRGGAIPAQASGHGLLGMRERVAAYGGELCCGRRPDGGYALTARIPLNDAPSAAPPARQLARRERYIRMAPRWMFGAVVVTGWLIAMELEAATSSARQGPWALNAAAVGAMALAAGWRRRSPLLFLAVVGAIAVALGGGLTSLDRSTVTGLYCTAVPLFTVAAWQPRNRAAVGLALWAVGAGIVVTSRHQAVGGLAGALVMAVIAWAAGRMWRAQRTINAELTHTTARLAAERDRKAETAVTSERTRIARELHAQVARGVVTMVIQAGAARKVLAERPRDATESIRAIEHSGRDALAQLRRILGVLRSPDRGSQAAYRPESLVLDMTDDVLA